MFMEGWQNGNALVLKTSGRKPLEVRALHPPPSFCVPEDSNNIKSDIIDRRRFDMDSIREEIVLSGIDEKRPRTLEEIRKNLCLRRSALIPIHRVLYSLERLKCVERKSRSIRDKKLVRSYGMPVPEFLLTDVGVLWRDKGVRPKFPSVSYSNHRLA